MPERPDLEHQRALLEQTLLGKRVGALHNWEPVLFRCLIPGELRSVFEGRQIVGVERVGHHLLFRTGAPGDAQGQARLMVVHPMLAGRFRLQATGERRSAHTGMGLELEGGQELRYLDDQRMGKIWLVEEKDRNQVVGLVESGVDVLGSAFTLDHLVRVAKGKREQVKVFLMDKGLFDSFGNAYADETLFRARLHPKRRVSELSVEELGDLHGAMRSTLGEAVAEVAKRNPPLDAKVRDFLQVRNRKGDACPVCGEPVRVCGVNGHDAFYCAICQPDPKERGLVRWSGPSPR
jgi:formamidopyrimidine-DNA glycosylase